MIKQYITESGSKYIIDDVNKTWQRKQGRKAATIRTDSGAYNTLVFVNRFGDGPCIYMICPPLPETGAIERYILSTTIVKEKVL